MARSPLMGSGGKPLASRDAFGGLNFDSKLLPKLPARSRFRRKTRTRSLAAPGPEWGDLVWLGAGEVASLVPGRGLRLPLAGSRPSRGAEFQSLSKYAPKGPDTSLWPVVSQHGAMMTIRRNLGCIPHVLARLLPVPPKVPSYFLQPFRP